MTQNSHIEAEGAGRRGVIHMQREQAQRAEEVCKALREAEHISGEQAARYAKIFLGRPTLEPDFVGFDTANIDLDPATRAERFSDDFNAYAVKFRNGPHGEINDVAGENDPMGQPGALCFPFSVELQERLAKVMKEHRHFAPDQLSVIDPRLDDCGERTLPPFDIHDPRQEIVCGLIAGTPRRLYALRGTFDGWELARLIHTDHIETRCAIGLSTLCVPELEREPVISVSPRTGETVRIVSDVTGEPLVKRSKQRRDIFTLSCGPFVVFFPLCRCCLMELFEGGCYPDKDSGYEFEEEDPRMMIHVEGGILQNGVITPYENGDDFPDIEA